ncbi:MAG: hypothetical protein ACRD7E_24155 [Bryobacteraceae bacterium]
MLCSELVPIWTKRGDRWEPEGVGVLEDVSASGFCVQLDRSVPLDMTVKIECNGGVLTGEVRHCSYRSIGYFTGVKLDEESRAGLQIERIEHLLDPGKLLKGSRVA